ncbi:MAG: MerC domain-containing protein [Rhodothermales bacterium]
METTINKKTISWWDWSGIFLSGLCLLHCVATPLLLAGVSFWLLSEWIHVLFIVMLFPITIIASRRTYLTGKKRWPVILLVAGLSILIAAVIFGEMMGEVFEVSMTSAASFLLIYGHLSNRHPHPREEVL